MGFFDKKKTTTTLEPMKEDFQMDAGRNLANFANTNLTQNAFVPGLEYDSISKMMTPAFNEQLGLDQLTAYQNKGEPETFTAGKNEMLNTLNNNNYDPTTGAYYEATRKNIEKERLKAVKDANNLMAKYGLNNSSYKRDRLSEVNENTFDKVSTLLATMSENERVRKLNAAPVAANMGNMENSMDLQKIAASQQYGGLPRILESVGYEDFLRQQNERQFPYGVAQNVFQTPMEYGKKSMTTESPSTFSKVIGPAIQAAGIALAPFTGGASIPIAQMVAPMATSAAGGDASSSGIGDMLSMVGGGGGGGGGGMGGSMGSLTSGGGGMDINSMMKLLSQFGA